VSDKRKKLPQNVCLFYEWEAGRLSNGARVVVGISDAPHYMSKRRAQELADEIVHRLCYGNDVLEPQEDVFV
jgi:hypothetical protein